MPPGAIPLARTKSEQVFPNWYSSSIAKSKKEHGLHAHALYTKFEWRFCGVFAFIEFSGQ